MKQFLAGLLVFGALSSIACGSDDKGNEAATYPDACNSAVAARCSRVWACNDKPAELLWGINEADCRTKWQVNLKCSTKACDSGTYNPARGQECVDQYRNETCDQASNAVLVPAACGAVCE